MCRFAELSFVNVVGIAGSTRTINQARVGNATSTAGGQRCSAKTACFKDRTSVDHWYRIQRHRCRGRFMPVGALSESVQSQSITCIYREVAGKYGEAQNNTTL